MTGAIMQINREMCLRCEERIKEIEKVWNKKHMELNTDLIAYLFDSDWRRGYVWCPLHKETIKDKEVPEGCPYILEQVVINQ
jgi:hypothetical protein